MPLTAIMEAMPQGTHMCSIYKNAEEKFAAIIPFMKGGLKKNEKCIYIVDEGTSDEICYYFNKAGLDVSRGLKWKQWQFLTKNDSYLKGGRFDPDKMIKLLEETQNTSLQEDFSGLRVTGEMTWVLTGKPGTERLIEYESKLNIFFPGTRSLAVCQYNETKFDEDMLMKVIHAHPKVVLYGDLHDNPFFIPPDNFEEVLDKDKTNYRSAVDTLMRLKKLI